MIVSHNNDKNIFIVENYQKNNQITIKYDGGPIHDKRYNVTDKEQSLEKVSKLITRHINLRKILLYILKKQDNSINRKWINYREREHKLLVEIFSAKSLKIRKISRENNGTQNLSQNADFSSDRIKKLIIEGENQTLINQRKIYLMKTYFL